MYRNISFSLPLFLSLFFSSLSANTESPLLVNVLDYGTDPANGTEIIQAAIDSGASVVYVPNPGTPWIVGPLYLRDNLTLIFDPGTLLQAKEGAYVDRGANLMSARGARNIRILGNGAELRMNREEYMNEETHRKGEWRHVIGLYGCEDVYVENLTVAGAGGDGFYLGQGGWTPPGQPGIPNMPTRCKNITLRQIVARENARQGISLISGENILIEDSVLRDTKGYPPQAGIDMEPNSPNSLLKNIVVRNVDSIGNQGSAFEIHIKKLNETSEPVSILIENCRAKDGGSAFSLHGSGGDAPLPGVIEIVDLYAENMRGPAINVREKPAESTHLRFVRAHFKNTAQSNSTYSRYPIWFQVRRSESLTQGGIEFIDCILEDNLNRPFFAVEDQRAGDPIGIADIKGNITVRSAYKPEIQISPEITPLVRDFDLVVDYMD